MLFIYHTNSNEWILVDRMWRSKGCCLKQWHGMWRWVRRRGCEGPSLNGPTKESDLDVNLN